MQRLLQRYARKKAVVVALGGLEVMGSQCLCSVNKTFPRGKRERKGVEYDMGE